MVSPHIFMCFLHSSFVISCYGIVTCHKTTANRGTPKCRAGSARAAGSWLGFPVYRTDIQAVHINRKGDLKLGRLIMVGDALDKA